MKSFIQRLLPFRLTRSYGLCALIAAQCSGVLLAQNSTFDVSAIRAVVFDGTAGVPIAKVADLLKHDLTAMSGHEPAVTSNFTSARGTGVIIGLAASPQIAQILTANKISTAPIDGKWETYGRAVIPAPWNKHERVLIIFGSDTRGTIWGVIDLTREMGVSAWEWWADVTIRHRDSIPIRTALIYSKTPSVKYRGIFLNAGAHGLNPWASKTFDPAFGNIGPRTYARIYELMWRLKANTIWPAMTESDAPFNKTPENAEVARDYAIVRGSSHVEMLLRTNSSEWDTKSMGPYNWTINRDQMIRYWSGAVQQFGKHENLYTIGLRNMSDFPMQGANTPEEMASVLSDVIAAQRKILSDELHEPADRAPQVFTAYKEILPAYDTGLLKLPDDVTINWPEDDFGYIRRLSNTQERKRSGGSGIYYHDNFWGPPMSYLWLDSVDPSLMWEEMTKAYKFNARRLWMLNVGSIKPGEFLIQFFLDMAFDTPSFGDSSSVHAYLAKWVEDNFGADHAAEITKILWIYYKLYFDRNPEFMAWTEVFPETPIQQTRFNMLDFGDENARRASAYKRIADEAATVMAELPDDRKAAFVQLVEYLADISRDLNLRQLDLDKSIAYGLQHRASANEYAEEAQKAQVDMDTQTHYYNDVMEGGKWRYMETTDPHDLPIYEAPHVPNWSSNGDRGCGVQIDGGAYFDGKGWWTPDLPAFHPELRNSSYTDIFVEGETAATWTATPNQPWIHVSRTAGGFSPATRHFEDRIEISLDWDKAPKSGDGLVSIECSTARQPYGIHVHVAPREIDHGASFIEADRIVSMYATHADSRSDGWEVLEGLGHTGADMRTNLDMKSVDSGNLEAVRSAPSAVYRFVTTTSDDKATLRLIALPTFPITSENGVRLAVSIDGGPLQIIDFYAPEFSSAWREHVMDNEAIETVPNLQLQPGPHTLTVYGLDPGVTLDRFEIAFTGAHQAYGPVPETAIKW
ncbi:MAG TPA: glycosyl hydrolase 115 family protein [Terracidiphilus sp.]|jgi:hypothetical protein